MTTSLNIGWHGYSNAGDDAMLQVILNWSQRYLGVQTARVLTTPDNRPAVSGSVRLDPVYKPRDRILLPPLKTAIRHWRTASADYVIMGGGNIFSNAKSIARKLDIVRRFQKRHPDGIAGALGVGFDPPDSMRSSSELKDLLNRLRFVMVRDDISARLVTETGYTGYLARTPDLVLALPEFSRKRGLSLDVAKKRSLGIALAVHGMYENTLDAVVDAARTLIADDRFETVTLLSFGAHHTLGDTLINAELNSRISSFAHVENYTYKSVPELIGQVRNCGFILAMRLHAQIFAYATATPYLTLAYHQKCFAQALRFEQPPDEVVPVEQITADILVNKTKDTLDRNSISALSFRHNRAKVISALEAIGKILT